VLKRYLIGVTAAAMISTAAAGAQTYGDDTQGTQPGSTGSEQTQPESTTQQDEPATTTQQDTSMQGTTGQTTTLTGCIYREQDVPGRSPNIAERAGVLEDYILAVNGHGGQTGTAGTTGTESTTGATGATGTSAGKMFKLEHADDEKLQSMVGKRVEVTGRVDAEAGDTRGTTGTPSGDQSMGPDQIELPEFEVTSIREVGGDCPEQPASGR